MDILNDHILSLTVLAPVLGALFIALLPVRSRALARWAASVSSGVSFLLASVIFVLIDKSGEFDFQELMSWIPGLGISYHVGVDGASAALLLMSAVVLAAVLFASFRDEMAEYKFFYSMILLSAGGAMGFFTSMNLYLMIFFYALAVFPIFMLIGMSGRNKGLLSSVKFLLFMASSVSLLFIGAAAISAVGGSSEILDIYSHRFSAHEQLFFFIIFAAGFGIATPLILLHSWVSDSVEDGPIASGILICAIVVKMGAYGFFRLVLPAFPAAALHYNTPMLVIAASGVIGGFLIAIAQKEFKRLIAFSTVAYMGIALIGLFSANSMSVTGSIAHMVNHGLTVAVIFAVLSVFCARGCEANLPGIGSMSYRLPVLSALLVFSLIAYAGAPFLNMFPGEFLIFLGAFQNSTCFAIIGMLGLAMAAALMIWTVARSVCAKISNEELGTISPVRVGEIAALIIMSSAIVLSGLFPGFIISRVAGSAGAFVKLANRVEMIVPASELGDSTEEDIPDIFRRE